LSGYSIDVTEVTLGAYENCVSFGPCSIPDYDDSECTWGKTNKQLPINCTNWYHANIFCTWAGKRLCTEAEWEYAANGPTATIYPWGNQQPDCTYAIMNYGSYGCGLGGPNSVGSKDKGKSPYNLQDMAGNVVEWVSDWYGSNYYCQGPSADVSCCSWSHCQSSSSPYSDPWHDPGGPEEGELKCSKGGGYKHTAGNLRISDRWWNTPAYLDPGFGFRCCLTAE
jgi:formylglycine-generating enzyme required for sulfatase activity